ncbi:hypothetical protein [Sulfurospirillum arcachonense]|uniref:hypothetical protein n=1 Tax=Sulfurospirillum arcachonense TaxID=57666 RepID=UPI000468A04A|nr:hypothetical protein [Sulfurospirillum arcachonense]
MLKIRVIFLLLISMFSILEAHKVPGMVVTAEKLDNNKMHIKAFYKKSKRPLIANEVRLISMLDNRVLKKGNITRKGIIMDIPKESYWIYVIVRDNDIVTDGIAPDGGFDKIVKKEKLAFLYTSLAAILFLLISFFIGYRRSKAFKQTAI